MRGTGCRDGSVPRDERRECSVDCAGLFVEVDEGAGYGYVLEKCSVRRDTPDRQASSKALANASTLGKRSWGFLASAVITTCSTAGGISGNLARRDGGLTERCCVATSRKDDP